MKLPRLRKIKLGLLFAEGIVYRMCIICCQTLFFWCVTGEFKLALGTSVAWNGINMCLYYLYHYSFLRLFSFGKQALRGVIWLTGLPCSGKTTIARALSSRLKKSGQQSLILDGDEVRSTLNKDLGFSREDRAKNMQRVVDVAEIVGPSDFLQIVYAAHGAHENH